MILDLILFGSYVVVIIRNRFYLDHLLSSGSSIEFHDLTLPGCIYILFKHLKKTKKKQLVYVGRIEKKKLNVLRYLMYVV